MFIYLFLREREQEGERKKERERETDSEAGSRLWVVSKEPNTGVKLINCEIMTWTKVRHNQLSHPGTLRHKILNKEPSYLKKLEKEEQTKFKEKKEENNKDESGKKPTRWRKKCKWNVYCWHSVGKQVVYWTWFNLLHFTCLFWHHSETFIMNVEQQD